MIYKKMKVSDLFDALTATEGKDVRQFRLFVQVPNMGTYEYLMPFELEYDYEMETATIRASGDKFILGDPHS